MTDDPLEIADFLADLKTALHGRRARARRRELFAVALIAAGALTSVAIGATYGNWWSGGAPAISYAGVPVGSRADARTVATTAHAALVAAPTTGDGYCLVPAVDGQADVNAYCQYDDGGSTVIAWSSDTHWVVYGRISDTDAAAIELAGAGLPGPVPLQRGGFFMVELPQAAWSTLALTRRDLTVLDGSGNVIRTGCMSWGSSPDATANPMTQTTAYDDRSSCADQLPPASSEFRPLPNPVPLPALTGTDVLTGNPIDGNPTDGKAGFLVVWQSYCTPCAKGLTDAQTFASAHPDVPVIGLDVEDLPAMAATQARKLGIQFPSVSADNQTIQPFGVAGYPDVLAFDTSGNVIASAVGDAFPAAFETELARLG